MVSLADGLISGSAAFIVLGAIALGVVLLVGALSVPGVLAARSLYAQAQPLFPGTVMFVTHRDGDIHPISKAVEGRSALLAALVAVGDREGLTLYAGTEFGVVATTPWSDVVAITRANVTVGRASVPTLEITRRDGSIQVQTIGDRNGFTASGSYADAVIAELDAVRT